MSESASLQHAGARLRDDTHHSTFRKATCHQRAASIAVETGPSCPTQYGCSKGVLGEEL